MLDVASEMGLDHHYEDFGQTMGRYGIGAGAYVVLPLLGPSTVRDAAALPLDRSATPPAFFDGTGTQVGLTVLQIINTRSGLLAPPASSTTSLSTSTPSFATPDLQRRRSLVFDGNAPETPQPPDGAASEAGAAARCGDTWVSARGGIGPGVIRIGASTLSVLRQQGRRIWCTLPKTPSSKDFP